MFGRATDNVENNYKTLVFAARIKDKDSLQKSSSGGMFTALSDFFLDQGGAVACSVYDSEKQSLEFRLITDTNKRNLARGSKYIQSIQGDIFNQCLQWLEENPNNKLLYVGMGCQAAGFRGFVDAKGIYDRVYIVDIICHGSPSPMLWKEYIQLLEKRHGGRATDLKFKDKRNGWKNPMAMVTINDAEVSLKEYVEVFYNKCALRPSCHQCPYASTERNTDMTIGDYWGIEKVMPDFYDPMGTSLVLIYNQRGYRLFEFVKSNLEHKESNVTDCLQPNLLNPTTISPKRESFWADYYHHGIEYVMKKNSIAAFAQRVKNKIVNIVGG